MKIKISLMICIIVVFSSSLMSYISGNWADCIYHPEKCPQLITPNINPPADENKLSVIQSVSLDGLLQNGAIYILQGQSNFISFLTEIEKNNYSEITPEYIEKLEGSIQNFEEAITIYSTFRNETYRMHPSKAVIEKLKVFDFDSFSNKNKLNSSIFLEIKTSLSNGDIQCIFDRFVSDPMNILSDLKNIKKLLHEGKRPDLSAIWKLSQAIAESELYREYISRIFYVLN